MLLLYQDTKQSASLIYYSIKISSELNFAIRVKIQNTYYISYIDEDSKHFVFFGHKILDKLDKVCYNIDREW